MTDLCTAYRQTKCGLAIQVKIRNLCQVAVLVEFSAFFRNAVFARWLDTRDCIYQCFPFLLSILAVFSPNLENAVLVGLGFAIQAEIRLSRHIAVRIVFIAYFRNAVFARRLNARDCIYHRNSYQLPGLVAFRPTLENAVLVGFGLPIHAEKRHPCHIAVLVVFIAYFRNAVFARRLDTRDCIYPHTSYHLSGLVVFPTNLENAVLVGLGFAVQAEIRLSRHITVSVVFTAFFRNAVFARRLDTRDCIYLRTSYHLSGLVVFPTNLENAVFVGLGLPVHAEIRLSRHITVSVVFATRFRNTRIADEQRNQKCACYVNSCH